MRFIKTTGQRAFTFRKPLDTDPKGFPAFLTRISSASRITLSDIAGTKVTYKKTKRPYTPMTMLELLEWQFLCHRPSLDNHNLLLTCNGVVDRDLDFVERYNRAYS